MGLFNFFRGNKTERDNYKKATYEKGPFMITCPFCFKKFKTEQVVFRASHYENGDPEYEKTVDDLLNEYNRKVGKGTLGEINPVIIPKDIPEKSKTRVDGVLIELRDKYDVSTSERLCPFCHNELPITSGRGPSKIISVVGASQVGKSVYMTTLLYALEKYSCERIEASLIAGSSLYNDEIRENQEKIFEKNIMLDPTPKQHIEPIIENMKFKDDKIAPITFIFYDIPGEGMTDRDYIEKHGEHIKNSDGIIFLVDPLQMRTLRKKISLVNREFKGDFTEKYQEPKDIIVYLFENFISKQSKEKTNIPTAIVVTKSDMLINLSDEEYISENSNIFRNYEHKEFFNLNEYENIDGEIRKFLSKADSSFKGTMDTYFGVTGYFAVSSLGCNPENLKIDSSTSINPLRVDEPFLWLLYQMNYLDGGRQ
ncbi:GTPase domain-containing protein [Clostridium lundense]|uniref:GTPase domain-containing protein n=1 Tax=Clostridium lundense TaxID=319475 RepID=UPI00047FAE8E|nr:GTPase domain-containing protein [Clostridium lundense]